MNNNNTNITNTTKSNVESMFEPFEYKNLQFRNHILAPPTLFDHANIDGTVTPALIKHYRTLARQGVGTIIVESAYVSKQGRGHVTQLGISDEEHLEGLDKLVQGIKKEGATIGIRLSHAGAHTSESTCGEQPVAPSVMNFGRDFDTSREFDDGDIEEIVLSFVHAAERAEEVGMDFIEINCAEQQLLDQCFTVKFNNRDDEYGTESVKNRIQLSLDILKAIRDRESLSLPLSFYFSVFEKIEDGFMQDDLQEMMKLLETEGLDIYHPLAVHAMNKCFENDDTLCTWTSRFTEKPMIIEGNLKSPQLLEEAENLGLATWFAIEQSIFSRPQWFQFLKRKIHS